MIFVARQLMEKTREHDDSLFMMFIDLKKAYDSVPRSALWSVLVKCGVPPMMVNIIKSFHEGMEASVRVGGTFTESFEVVLRQGCTMAPTLFNLYFNAMVSVWHERCGEISVSVLYKFGRKLMGDRTAKSRLSRAQVSESQFADDLALCAVNRSVFESAGRKFVEVGSQFGLTVSIPKTKGLAMGTICEGDGSPVDVGTGMVEMVKNFTYLGSILSSDCEATCEVKCRLARASKAFGALRVPIFSNRYLCIC